MNSTDEMLSRIVDRAGVDGEFRDRLLSDPKAAVHEELGVEIPDDVVVEVHQSDLQTIHLSLPPTNLAAEQLEAISAGRCCCSV